MPLITREVSLLARHFSNGGGVELEILVGLTNGLYVWVWAAG